MSVQEAERRQSQRRRNPSKAQQRAKSVVPRDHTKRKAAAVHLPHLQLLRFRDLKHLGVINNWVTLKRLVDEQGFPPGIMISPRSRAWRQQDVAAWIEARPQALGNVGFRPKRSDDIRATA